MSQMIITIKREKNGYVCVDCDGSISIVDMVHMITRGFDKLKLQFREDLREMQKGNIEKEYIETNSIIDRVNEYVLKYPDSMLKDPLKGEHWGAIDSLDARD